MDKHAPSAADAELDRLAAEASKIEQPSADQSTPQPEVLDRDSHAENRDLLLMLRDFASPLLPFLPDCYPDSKIDQIAVALTAVERKHGFKIAAWFEQWGEEIALAIALGPPTLRAVKMGREHFARAKDEAKTSHAAA